MLRYHRQAPPATNVTMDDNTASAITPAGRFRHPPVGVACETGIAAGGWDGTTYAGAIVGTAAGGGGWGSTTAAGTTTAGTTAAGTVFAGTFVAGLPQAKQKTSSRFTELPQHRQYGIEIYSYLF